MMLMYGILEYIIITGTPQLGAAPPPSGLGLDPIHTGFLQVAFGLGAMIFGPVFGIMVAKRKGFNLKLLVPGIGITAISFVCCFCYSTLHHQVLMLASLFLVWLVRLYQTQSLSLSLGLHLKNIRESPQPLTNMMRIIGGAIGPVLTTVIITSVTIPITVDNVEKNYPSPVNV